MPASIFSGQKVKALKSTLNLNNGADIISSTVDPTSSAVDAVPGSLLLNTSTGKMYRKNDSGSSTNWTEVGSGVGGINYILNPNADSGVTGWATYADAAGAAPVDGTGGSANITWAVTSTNPLRGASGFLLTKDAANRQGQGVSYDFAIDRADSTGGIGPAVQQISFDYQITSASGTYGYGTSSTNSDLTIYVYDVTNSQLIQPAGYKIDGGRVRATFQPNSSSRNYRLIFHIATTSATAWTMQIDNVQVGPQVRSYGPAMSDWVSYAPVLNATITPNATGYVGPTGRWRRVGDTLEVQAFVQNGTGGTATGSGYITLSIPSGLTIDTTKLTGTGGGFRCEGVGIFSGTSTGSGTGVTAPSNTTLALLKDSTNDYYVVSDFVAAARFSVKAWLPIVGWSSNTLVSDSAETRVVAAKASTTVATAFGPSDVKIPFSTVSVNTHGSWSTDTFTAPIPGFYRVSARITTASVAYTAGNLLALNLYKSGVFSEELGRYIAAGTVNAIQYAGGSTVIQLNANETLDVRAFSSVSTTINSAGGYSYIAIERLSGPSQIAASEIIAAYYTGSLGSALSTSSQFMDFGNKQIDTHNAVLGAGSGLNTTYTNTWRYVCPAPGLYRLTATLETSGVTILQQYVAIEVFKNGVAWPGSIRRGPTNPTTTSIRLQPSTTTLIQCVAGDVISVATALNTGTLSLSGNTDSHSISIERVGGVM